MITLVAGAAWSPLDLGGVLPFTTCICAVCFSVFFFVWCPSLVWCCFLFPPPYGWCCFFLLSHHGWYCLSLENQHHPKEGRRQLCVGGPHRSRKGTESCSASPQAVRYSHLWRGSESLSSSVIDIAPRYRAIVEDAVKPSVRGVLWFVGYRSMTFW